MDRGEGLTFKGLHPGTSISRVLPLKASIASHDNTIRGWGRPQVAKCLLLGPGGPESGSRNPHLKKKFKKKAEHNGMSLNPMLVLGLEAQPT